MWVELKLSKSTLLHYLRMLKSINKNPKLSDELQKEGFGFFGENSCLLFIYLFIFCVSIFLLTQFKYYLNSMIF